jgi:hypothetical protein
LTKKGDAAFYPWAEQVSRISSEHLELDYHKQSKDFEKWKPKIEKKGDKNKTTNEYSGPINFLSRMLERVQHDIAESREFVANFYETQEIHDFAQEWKKMNNISPEMTFYKETWEKIKIHEKLISRIPSFSNKRGTILIETLGFKNYLSELPKQVINSIRYNVASTMEKDTRALKDDLYKVVETLEQAPSSINIYLEQINMWKYISFKMPEFTQKFQSIDNLSELCKQDNIKINASLQEDIERVKELYQKLPSKLAEAEDALKAKQASIETIIHSSSDTLSKKIRAFQKKYIETYLQDKNRIDEWHQTLEELFKRSKAIQEIKSKVILYKEFFNKKVELESSKNFDKLHELHIQTINLWKMILYWRKRREMWYTTPFLQLDIDKVIRSIKKTSKYFEDKVAKYPLLNEKSKILSQVILNQWKETSTLINFLKNWKKESLKPRHWNQIFMIIKAPHLRTSQKFTIINLREVHIQNYMDEVNRVIEQADLEMKYENILAKIQKDWEQMRLKFTKTILCNTEETPQSVSSSKRYTGDAETFILIDIDATFDKIEDHLTTLEGVSQSKNASHVKEKTDGWIKNLIIMRDNLQMWMEAQSNWMYLDPIFASYEIQQALPTEYNKFLDLQDSLKRIYFSAYMNPKAMYNLVVNNRVEIFKELIGYFTKIKKVVDDYLEERRMKYPRFFFLSDWDFLDFLVKAGGKQSLDYLIDKIFPGAASLYMSATAQECNCEEQWDGNWNKLGNIPASPEEVKEKILGMVSHRSDLLLFERAINYHPRAEVWLLKVEYSAQETVGKLIGHAVSSFPKQPLDEWIIDYPQQTILSTIHLILTHEINEMLHEMRAVRKSEDPSISHSGPTDTMGLINESSNINTRSINQLQESSRLTQTEEFPSKEHEELPEEIQEADETSKISAEGEGSPEAEGEGRGKSIIKPYKTPKKKPQRQ